MNSRCRTCLAAVPHRAAPPHPRQPRSAITLSLRGPPGSAPLLYDLQWAPLTSTTSTTSTLTHNTTDDTGQNWTNQRSNDTDGDGKVDVTFNTDTQTWSGDTSSYSTTGADATVHFNVTVGTLPKVNTILLLPKDGSYNYNATMGTPSTTDDLVHYTGTQKFYLFDIEMGDGAPAPFEKGLNKIIIPQTVFFASAFYNHTNNSNDLSSLPYIDKNYQWVAPSTDGNSDPYTINSIALQYLVDCDRATWLLYNLTHNATDATGQNWTNQTAFVLDLEITNSEQLYALGLPEKVITLIPFEPFKFVAWESVVDDDSVLARVGSTLVDAAFAVVDAIRTGLEFMGDVLLTMVRIGISLLLATVGVVVEAIQIALNVLVDLVADRFINMVLAPFMNAMNDVVIEGQNGKSSAFHITAIMNREFNAWNDTHEGNPLASMATGAMFSSFDGLKDNIYLRLAAALILVAVLVLAMYILMCLLLAAIITTTVNAPLGLLVIVGLGTEIVSIASLIWSLYFRDTDNDGLSTIDEWILAPEGADPNKKDLFVEIDYYEGYKPRTDALEYVNSYFDGKGIDIHLWVDDKLDKKDRHYHKSGVDKSERNAIERWHHNRDTTYIYVVYVNTIDYEGDSAEGGDGIYSDDFGSFIAVDNLMSWPNANNEYDGGLADEVQSMMHEIGHNLKMSHKSYDDDNDPNTIWWDVMSIRVTAEVHRNGELQNNNDINPRLPYDFSDPTNITYFPGDKIQNHSTITTAFPEGGPEYSNESWNELNLKKAKRDYSSWILG